MDERNFVKTRAFDRLFGISVGGLVILTIIFTLTTNQMRFDLEEIKSGDVYAKTITADKLADDVFKSIDLQLEDGSIVSAELVKATITDGELTDSLEFKIDDGSTFTAKVLNETGSQAFSNIFAGTSNKISTIVVNKVDGSTTNTNLDIKDGSIITAKLADGAVTAEKLADGSVGTLKLLDGSITSGKLTDGVILSQHLANSSVTSFKIADNSITASKLLDNIITAEKIVDQGVTAPKLANGSVTTIKLADGSVTSLKIVAGAVEEGKLADGSVTAFKIADNAVITAKILDGNITEAKLASGSISLSKLSNAMCSNGEVLQKSAGVWACTALAPGGVTSVTAGSGLANSGTASDPILDANVDNVTIEISGDALQIKDGAITNSKLAADAVTTDKIDDATIMDADISASAAVAWSKISKVGSSLADLATRNFSDVNSRNANLLAISDVGGYFSSSEAEGALQEVGNSLSSLSGTVGTAFVNGGNAFGGNATLGTNDNYSLTLKTAGSPALTILNDGKVGIGETNPTLQLVVASNGTGVRNSLAALNTQTAAAGVGTRIGFLGTTSQAYISGLSGIWEDSGTNGSLTLETRRAGSLTEAVRILSSGNLGIGDSTPQSLLTVGANDAFQVNSSGNIVNLGGAAHSIVNSSGALNIDSATTGAINLGAGANAKTITVGNNTGATALNFVSGTGSQSFTSSATVNNAFVFTANTLTSGHGLLLQSSAASGTGDLFRVNATGTVGNLVNILNNGSSVFAVSQTQITANLPAQFNAPGDVAVAYDLLFTNPTTSFIKSNSPLYLQSGEVFNSSNLVLKTFNSGAAVFDTPGGVTLSYITNCSSGIQSNGSGVLSCISSDERIKENIQSLETPLDKVLGLRGVSYNWKDKKTFGAQSEIGLIAQEVEGIVPELVFTMGNGLKGVKYQQLTALLVEAVKQQQTQLSALQAQLGLSSSTTVQFLTQENSSEFFAQNVIPSFKVKKITINEEVVAQSVKVIGDAEFYGKADFNDQVAFRNKINVGKDSAGKVTIAQGQNSITVNFASDYAEVPIVTVTPIDSSLTYVVKDITKSGFTIKLSANAPADITFNWIVVGVDTNDPLSYPGS